MSEAVSIRLEVNGTRVALSIPANLMLVDLLRDHLSLRGTKLGCDQGACGACTVLIDGRPATSCLTFAFMADGTRVMTIEGVAAGGALDLVQQAMVDAGAAQCGFCAPGMVLMAKACQIESSASSAPSQSAMVADTEQWLQSNICRCSGYQVLRRALALAGLTAPTAALDDSTAGGPPASAA